MKYGTNLKLLVFPWKMREFPDELLEVAFLDLFWGTGTANCTFRKNQMNFTGRLQKIVCTNFHRKFQKNFWNGFRAIYMESSGRVPGKKIWSISELLLKNSWISFWIILAETTGRTLRWARGGVQEELVEEISDEILEELQEEFFNKIRNKCCRGTLGNFLENVAIP